jgi:hypothetical protein
MTNSPAKKTALFFTFILFTSTIFSQKVTPVDLKGWNVNELNTGNLTFLYDPVSPLPCASVQLSSPDGFFVKLKYTGYENTLLSNIKKWGYWTKVETFNPSIVTSNTPPLVNRDYFIEAPVLVISIERPGVTRENLVFAPRYQSGRFNQTPIKQNRVELNKWQEWNALNGLWTVGVTTIGATTVTQPTPDTYEDKDLYGPEAKKVNGMNVLFTLKDYIDNYQANSVKIIKDKQPDGFTIRLNIGKGKVPSDVPPQWLNYIGYTDGFYFHSEQAGNNHNDYFNFETEQTLPVPDSQIIIYACEGESVKLGPDISTVPAAAGRTTFSWSSATDKSFIATSEINPTIKASRIDTKEIKEIIVDRDHIYTLIETTTDGCTRKINYVIKLKSDDECKIIVDRKFPVKYIYLGCFFLVAGLVYMWFRKNNKKNK